MAEIFLARTVGSGKIGKFVALKRILPEFSGNAEFIEMFKEEARIAMNLNHGNVVTIFDFGLERGQFFLAMDYVEGQNLRQIFNYLQSAKKRFSTDQCLYIAQQVAAGLDYVHRCIDSASGRPLNLRHRDISPQNIMISFEGEVKIVDFGIAKADSEMEKTRIGTIKGKFGYMSPEQAEGLPIASTTDIFSLGIVLWEMLTGARLFNEPTEIATINKILACQIPSPRLSNDAVSEELDDIVRHALMKEPSERYPTCALLYRELTKCMNKECPEFTPQEFSIFMKSTFSDMYINNRKKLADYTTAFLDIAPNELPAQTDVVPFRGDTVRDLLPSQPATETVAEMNPVEDRVNLDLLRKAGPIADLKKGSPPLVTVDRPFDFQVPGKVFAVTSRAPVREGSAHGLRRSSSYIGTFVVTLFFACAVWFLLYQIGWLPSLH